MYVRVLQNCIYATLIFNSNGFPQDDIPNENLLPGNDPLENSASNDNQPEGVNTNTPLNTPSDDGLQENEDTSPKLYNVPSNDEYMQSNENSLTDIPPKVSNDDLPDEAVTEKTDYGASEIDPDYDDYDKSDDEENKTVSLPGSVEMLDRNNPEPGFDLSFDEMMKLKLWPDGLIPYYIDVHSFSDKVLRDKIRSFLNSVNSLTSLNFLELPSPPVDNSRWVLFINRRGLLGCADHSIKNFTNTGVQHVILGYHCMSTEGELAEAVLAIAGVPPQHNSPDRDNYIKVNFDNIMPDKKFLFQKHFDDKWLFHDLAYDFKSAGHFHSYKHSINGRATIEPQVKSKDVTLGESTALTATDILKIRMIYNYIVNKKLLQAPDCHKLFEPGKMFGKYKPTEKILKPRHKPYKYTGEAADASLENNEDIVPDVTTIADVEIDEAEVSITVKPTEVDDINDYEGNNDNKNGNEDVLEENNYDQNVTTPGDDPDESENMSPSDFYNGGASAGNKPVIVSIGKGNIQALNQKYNSHTLQAPMVKIKEDVISYLSDYHTDDDIRLKRNYKKEDQTL